MIILMDFEQYRQKIALQQVQWVSHDYCSTVAIGLTLRSTFLHGNFLWQHLQTTHFGRLVLVNHIFIKLSALRLGKRKGYDSSSTAMAYGHQCIRGPSIWYQITRRRRRSTKARSSLLASDEGKITASLILFPYTCFFFNVNGTHRQLQHRGDGSLFPFQGCNLLCKKILILE